MSPITEQMQVLVVGAGPTGLTAAIELARRGVVPDVIDRKDAASTLSRAVGILPSSLATLTPSGVTRRLLAEGAKIQELRLYRAACRLLCLSLRGGHPEWDFVVALAQDRTEAALRDALVRYGGSVRYGTELVGLRETDDQVAVQYLDGGEAAYDYVIGADGTHSATRNAMGIEFPGFDLPESWSIADVDAAGWPNPRSLTLCALEHGRVVFVAPLASDRYRVVSNTDDALAALPLEMEVIRKRREGQFQIAIRQVREYRRGRVLLAGDAAHCHSPAGGRGMNLGIADAAELAERIVENRLDGYSDSRRAAGARTIAESEQMRRLFTSTGFVTKRLVFAGARLTNALRPLQRRIASRFLGN